MTKELHPLLRRQLARCNVDASAPAFAAFVAEVDQAYRQIDSDRELLERSLELTSQELVESRQALTGALGASRVAIWSWAPSRDESMIEGYPSPLPDGKTGRSQGPASSFLDVVHAGARERVANALARALESRSEVYERFVLAGVDPERHIELRGRVDPDSNGTRLTGVLRDVSDEIEAERTHAQSQKLESLGLLAGGVAHDFNNLLVPILTISRSVIEELPPGSSMAEELKDVFAAGQRARDITAQLLAFGRKQVFDLAVVDIDEQLRSAHRLLVRLVPENVSIELSLAAGGTARVDPTQFQQVLINLVANARDAMPGGGSIRIATRRLGSAGAGDDAVEIAIADGGTGIEPRHIDHVFEPFYSTKKPGSGTGLGLATAYGIVQQHGGTIRVTSEVGRGSTFVITLPTAAPAPLVRRETSRPPPRGAETLLVCEDDDAVRRVVVRELQRRGGYRVLAAASGEEALALLESEQGQTIDLLVTDVVLTGMSGPDLARAAIRGGRNLPRLFMSGHAHGVLAPSGVLDSGTRLLQKPFTTGELLGAVRELLDDVVRT